MLTRWTEQVFDDRLAPARIVLLVVVALGDLRLLHPPEDAADWALALGALAMCLAASVIPVIAAVTLSLTLLLSGWVGAGVAMTLKAMIVIALFEVALRSGGRRAVAGVSVSAVLVGAHVAHLQDEYASTLYRVVILLGVPLLLGAYVRLTREHARREREHAAEERRRRHSETAAARAAERTAIARELHDLVAHHVSSMVLRVGVARHVLPDADPRVTEVLDDLHGSGTAALADLRHLVSVLRDPARAADVPPVDPDGLPEALHDAAERGRQAGVDIEADIDPAVALLDNVRGLTVLRLAQEGLANVAKHAGPHATARLTVRLTESRLHLRIDDDGGLRAPPPAAASAGHGLIGMTERVELLGGTLHAGPPAGGIGWRLAAELPMPVTVEGTA
ncbi:sensor histidine kinase [Thermomonospora umbrina]|uniref:histidine kinase n=1 Tax=Thermomonospora umbrina TaxID=111806 RepID=A0A3D9SXE8_9ACTN|nr:histidine kinase [Thermomonospora umbrina]REE98723.1 signal transduction histidine kinase [Thermomonospora umbrina]